jgi:hypothetical protein
MGKKERDRINERLMSLSENERMFRINAGMGWAGQVTRKGRFVVIDNPRPFHGAPDGFPDLCGWTTVEITPDMVGRRVAVFTAEEVKATGELSPGQERFRDVIIRMGGIHRVLSS